MLPSEERDPKQADAAEESLRPVLLAVERVLADRAHLIGDGFGVDDLNAASVAVLTLFAGFDLADVPCFDNWLRTCLARPAARRASRRR